MNLGLYSIVQYMPDLARAEGCNIGIVLISDDGAMMVKMTNNANRVSRFFNITGDRLLQFLAFKESFKNRLMHERGAGTFATIEGLDKFIENLANQFQMTKPRWVKYGNLHDELRRLFDMLVDSDN